MRPRQHASEAVAELLAEAGIEFVGSAHAEVEHGAIRLRPGDRRLAVDGAVALPALTGRRLEGLPRSPDGFVTIDEHARVVGVDDIFAVGEMTAFPIQQGGIASQQADAAATALAAEAGAPVAPLPFRPVLRGMLLLGRPGAARPVDVTLEPRLGHATPGDPGIELLGSRQD